MNYLVNDVESVGLNPPAAPASGVVEVAWALIDPISLLVTDEFVSLVNPGCEIAPQASAIHGIYEHHLVDAKPLEEVFAIKGPTVSIGHNTSFDLKFLAPHYENLVGSLCTLSLARQYVKGSANHKLGTLADHLGLKKGVAHSAMGDVHTTVELLRYLVNESGRTLEQLVAAARKPKIIHQMPFGKHKGMMVMDLPLSYVRWFLEQEIDHDLRKSLEQTLKVRAGV